MQKLIISGMVTRDGELRRTQGGDSVLGFSIVCDNGKDKQGNRRDGTFYDCSIWGKRADALSGHITKGKYLSIEGRPTAREHNGKVYMGVSVNDFSFCGEKQGGGTGGGYDQSPPSDQGGYGGTPARDLDDDIPF
jgi:single-strand DNA-binding protein